MNHRIVIFIVTILTMPIRFAYASDPLLDKILPCFTRPPFDTKIGFSMTFNVIISDNGDLEDITIKDGYKANLATIEGFRRAIMKCAPYDAESGSHEIIVESKNILSGLKSLDPFKGAKPAPSLAD